MKPFLFAGAIFIMVTSAFATHLPLGTLATPAEVEAFTGGHTRVVWVEHMTGMDAAGDWDVTGWKGGFHCLKGFDTKASNPYTTIVPGPAAVANPQFTPDGNQIIFSDIYTSKKVWMVNWDGTGKKSLVDGWGLYVWKDPSTQKVWLYYNSCYIGTNGDKDDAGPIKRVRLDDLSKVETVWDKSKTNQVFRLSRDGRYASATSPWPEISILDLQAGTKKVITQGCNPQIAPDNSYRLINFENGNHSEIAVWGPNGAGPKVMLNIGFARWHFDHHSTELGDGWAPRFSTSKAEIMTVNSPLFGSWNATGCEIFIAKFNAGFTDFIKLPNGFNNLRITNQNGRQKTYAMAWISDGSSSSSSSKETFIARGAPVLKGLQLQLPVSGVYTIDIFTPRGARAGSFLSNASGAFDLSHAGLSNGVYQIRVRAGSDIFWLKAPVVR